MNWPIVRTIRLRQTGANVRQNCLHQEERLENKSIRIWMVPSASHTHTHTHIPTSVHQRQTTQTVSSARQPCHPTAEGRIWSCLFDSNLIHFNPVAIQCLLKDFGNIHVCVWFQLLLYCSQNQKWWKAPTFGNVAAIHWKAKSEDSVFTVKTKDEQSTCCQHD